MNDVSDMSFHQLEDLQTREEEFEEALGLAIRENRAKGWREAAHEAARQGLSDAGVLRLLMIADEIQQGKRP